MSIIDDTTDAIWEAVQRVSPPVTRDEIAQLLTPPAQSPPAQLETWLPPFELRRDETLDIAFAAAQASTSEIPAIITGMDVLQMGEAAWLKIRKSGHWVSLYNRDAVINLEHPDVRRALADRQVG